MRAWCSLVSLKLAKLITRIQIPAPALHYFLRWNYYDETKKFVKNQQNPANKKKKLFL